MNKQFIHPTYGEIRYVVEDGTFYYCHSDIARALGTPDGGLGCRFYDYLKDKYGDLRINLDPKGRAVRPLTSEDVKEYYCSRKCRGARAKTAPALYEWLKGQEERALNAVPCASAPVEAEQPTESKNCLSEFDAIFDAFIAEMKKEVEVRKWVMEAGKGLRGGALKYKDMYQRMKAKCNALTARNANLQELVDALKAQNANLREQNANLQELVDGLKARNVDLQTQNADLQAQIEELKKPQVDISFTSKLRKELVESRTLLGEKVLKECFVRHYEENGIAIKREPFYEPTAAVGVLQSMGIDRWTLTAASLNRYLMERGYQYKNPAKELNPKAAAYIVADFLGDEYAIMQHVHKENNQDFNQLQWTFKGLALIVGTMQTIPPALTIDNIHSATTFTSVARC